MGDQEMRFASRDQWSGAAQGWAQGAERRELGPAGLAADWMLEAVALRPGQRVLELACGAGDVGLRAAQAVGPSGRVLCSDFAEPMVAIVRERAAGAGLAQVEARVLDAEEPQLGQEDRFDAVLCRFGYMLMADPARALRASAGVLDGDGRLALAVWGPAKRNPWLSLLTDATMDELSAPPPAPGTPGPFALADQGRLRELLANAGLDEIQIEDLEGERGHESLEEWWEGTQQESGPISSLFKHLSEPQLASIHERAMVGAAQYVRDDGTVGFPARVTVASARRIQPR